jgi:hypothetical protein
MSSVTYLVGDQYEHSDYGTGTIQYVSLRQEWMYVKFQADGMRIVYLNTEIPVVAAPSPQRKPSLPPPNIPRTEIEYCWWCSEPFEKKREPSCRGCRCTICPHCGVCRPPFLRLTEDHPRYLAGTRLYRENPRTCDLLVNDLRYDEYLQIRAEKLYRLHSQNLLVIDQGVVAPPSEDDSAWLDSFSTIEAPYDKDDRYWLPF